MQGSLPIRAGEFTNTMLYQDDYGNLTDDPYAITGRNIGEPKYRERS